MSDAPHACPLAWPIGWPRTPPHKRRKSTFQAKGKPLTVFRALERTEHQLTLLGARYLVISTNMELRNDGRPRSDGRMSSSDPGAAVYFQLKSAPTVMPCDAFTTLADNLAAIANHIDAVRRIERYGVGTLDQMFTGFQAIRGPGPKPWREVLGIPPGTRVTPDLIRERRVALARKFHPDNGGSDALMSEINAAADQAFGEIRRA